MGNFWRRERGTESDEILWSADSPAAELRGTGMLRAAQEMNFDVLALGFAPKFANQREGLAADCEMPTIMLDAQHLLERRFIERWLTLPYAPIRAQ